MDMEKIYRTYYMKIYSYALTRVRDAAVAEDIAQHTFVKAMKAQSAYRGTASEWTWLCAIARNLCNDYFRARKRETTMPPEELTEQGEVAPPDLLARETTLVIHRILHTLPEPYKEVFAMRVFGELAFAEIAEIFGKSESWARVTYHRARLKIKERMEKHE